MKSHTDLKVFAIKTAPRSTQIKESCLSFIQGVSDAWHDGVPISTARGRLRQEIFKFKASLGCTLKPASKAK